MMKRYVILVTLTTNYSVIATILNVTRSFMFRVRKELLASERNISSVAKRRKHS
uniref:Uncharacterized protein n=1 Tax=Octopus bimaculoides TaxID=37653 RepID=A0A0L8GX07_OCTBM